MIKAQTWLDRNYLKNQREKLRKSELSLKDLEQRSGNTQTPKSK